MRKTVHFPGSLSLSLMTCIAHRVNMGPYEGSNSTMSMCGGLKVITKKKGTGNSLPLYEILNKGPLRCYQPGAQDH